MNDHTRDLLVQLNHKFYGDFAKPFSATRQKLQPGVKRILASLQGEESILDLGCGNGHLWKGLKRLGHQGQYVGLDFSPQLLEIAREKAGQITADINELPPIFLQADLSTPGWSDKIPKPLPPFDVTFAFAILHHLPGEVLRRNILLDIHDLLIPHGKFIHSEWQFLNSLRLKERIQPWSILELDPGDLEAGDTLLDWRREGRGLRYVHHFDRDELKNLASASGFTIIDTFESDGGGGALGLYQVWEAIQQPVKSISQSLF